MHDVEFDLLEGRGHLVLDDLHARGVADDIVPVLDLAGAANVETDGSIKFQCITACRGLRITIHHTDLHAHLIDEDDCAPRTAARTGDRKSVVKGKKGSVRVGLGGCRYN